ncbi:MAG TPA: rod shape-determining protein RodA [Candidatus Paceibacterota bacterium]|nr:rod shape-determining protein RodA [Candidatus Paceibacterota bacterium]
MFSFRAKIDWLLVAAIIPLMLAGLITMNSFSGQSSFFTKQLFWIGVSFVVFFAFSFMDFRFLRRTGVLVSLYAAGCGILAVLLVFGRVVNGAQSWVSIGLFSIQPTDPIKIVLILVLAKYFSRRHVDIANIRHILVSGAYTLILFALIALQPDFGSAIIIAAIWFGMVLVSGISKKHLLAVVLIGAVALGGAWLFLFKDYQKARILTFLHPMSDTRGAGYNAYQSMIAVGSGELLGEGIGYGTQSRLNFLPEHETDFIFASFAEEWGFLGVLILFLLFGIVIWRILHNAMLGETNFEILYGAGVAILLMAHIIVHVGINIGLLPVTGTTIPFLSYGGSHLVTEMGALGILMGMRKYGRVTHRENMELSLNER